MPAYSIRGPLSVRHPSLNLDDGTLCRAESPKRFPVGTDAAIADCESLISSELRAACTLPDTPGTRAYEKVQARKVLSWLRLHQASIVNAEAVWTIDRRAVAGAIAWEALKNIKENRFYSRWSGPGKIHYVQYTRMSVLEEVATLGYLKAGSKDERRLAVQDIDGAANAIGAIMRAFADVAAQLGGYCDFYWWPVLLVNFYNAWNISDAVRHFTTKKAPSPLGVGNDMARWLIMNLDYIQDAVGRLPDGCRPKPTPFRGVKPFGNLCSGALPRCEINPINE